MMIRRRIGVAMAAIALLAALAVVAPTNADESQAGLAPGAYRLTSLRVDVEPTNSKGRAWDVKPSPDPDPKAVLSVGDRIVATCRASETLSLSCSVDADIEVALSSEIRVEVWDEDALSDDVVGTAVLSDSFSWKLGTELSMTPTGRIRHATVRLAARPTWWQAHRWHVVVGAAGLLAAMGVLVAHRRGLVRLTPEPPRSRRCAHCEALLDATVNVCGHCGARVRA
jgi:hypothetical protein